MVANTGTPGVPGPPATAEEPSIVVRAVDPGLLCGTAVISVSTAPDDSLSVKVVELDPVQIDIAVVPEVGTSIKTALLPLLGVVLVEVWVTVAVPDEVELVVGVGASTTTILVPEAVFVTMVVSIPVQVDVTVVTGVGTSTITVSVPPEEAL